MKYVFIIFAIILMLIILLGCAEKPNLNPNMNCNPDGTPNGGLNWLRLVSIVGIGVVVFLALANATKWYFAAIAGIGTVFSLTSMCRYYEKYFALIIFIAVGISIILLLISLFVKNKGIFLSWRKND
jgi:magnesium-transporting ATPase (P-type)